MENERIQNAIKRTQLLIELRESNAASIEILKGMLAEFEKIKNFR